MNTMQIPVISIKALFERQILSLLDDACREWGFFQVVDHGIDTTVLDNLQRAMVRFFALSPEEKRAVARTEVNPWGFYDRELTKNTRDWKEIFDHGPESRGGIVPQWPAAFPDFRFAVLAHYEACEALAFKLLAALALNLGMERASLDADFTPIHSSFLRLNYYPLCPQPLRPAEMDVPQSGHLGINPHTDAGALTILLQDDQPGLEVYRHGAWHLVEPNRNALVINIGDIVQVWSNDGYRASLHRVIASSEQPRYSAPFFFNPAYSASYAPLPSTVSQSQPPRYRAINWGEFRSRRAAGDYADQGEEIQISHYRSDGRRESDHGSQRPSA